VLSFALINTRKVIEHSVRFAYFLFEISQHLSDTFLRNPDGRHSVGSLLLDQLQVAEFCF
jgi:hypothetical protein